MDITEALAGARLPEKTVPICLRGDLQARFEELERQLVAAQRDTSDSLAAGSRPRELAEQIEALRREMADHTVTFTLRAVPRRAWTKLVADHPPREDNQVDRVLGVNEETFISVLIREATVDPELTDDQWDLLDEKLTEFQWQKLFNAAWSLNARDVDVPFSHAASTILRATAGG
jgi:hypothetical protein